MLELDALRGIAVALVIAYHYISVRAAVEQTLIVSLLTPLFRVGWVGVDLFFVLSGFLIGSILIEHATAPNFFKAFYIRRAARLLPLYLLVVLLYLLAKVLVTNYGSASAITFLEGPAPLPWWSYLLYVQNLFQGSWSSWGSVWLAPTWSLAVEEQFYLIAPLLVIIVPRPRLAICIGALIAAAFVCRTWNFMAHDHWLPSYVVLQCRADALLVGMAGALILANQKLREIVARRTDVLIGCLWLTGVLVLAINVADLSLKHWAIATFGHTVLAAFGLNIIFVALFTEGWFCRVVLRNPRLIALGGISYAAYLLHEPVHGLLVAAAGEPHAVMGHGGHLGIAIIALALTIGLAHLSAAILERPFLALGRRYQYDTQRGIAQPV